MVRRWLDHLKDGKEMMTLDPIFLRVQEIFTFQPTLHPRGHTCPHIASCAPCQGTWEVPNKSKSLLIANLSRQVQQLFIIPISSSMPLYSVCNSYQWWAPNFGALVCSPLAPPRTRPKEGTFLNSPEHFSQIITQAKRRKRVDVLFHQAALVLWEAWQDEQKYYNIRL